MKLLVKDSYSPLVYIKSSELIFYAEKNVSSFCSAKASHIILAKNCSVFVYNMFNRSQLKTSSSNSWAQDCWVQVGRLKKACEIVAGLYIYGKCGALFYFGV